MHGVRPLAEDLAGRFELTLWDVEFVREAGRETLRIALDRTGGVDAEQLRDYSDALSRELDESDLVPGGKRYWLEVTSPGAERKLREPEQFRICVGRLARLTFKDGREPVVGEIASVDDDAVTLRVEDGELRVAYETVSQARLQLPGV